MKKKGSLSDGIYLVIGFFVIAIVFVLGYKMLFEINTNMQDSSGVSDNGKTLVQQSTDNYVNIFNNAFLFLFLGLVLAVIIGAYYIRSHPALYWLSVPILAFIIWIGAIYSNIFVAMTGTTEISPYLSAFTYITFIFNNYVFFITGIVLLLALALFAKNPSINE